MSQDHKPDAHPIDAQEFEQLMKQIGLSAEGKSLAVAVSGGADSMALSLLVARWGKAVYLSFDHGLRPQSKDEAVQVKKWLEKRGLVHVTLSWRGEKPTTGIQQAARAARYSALEKWCVENGIGQLLLAHHEGDQAETFLLRLVRGSGVDGLSAMAPVTPSHETDDGPLLCRPLLSISKARLIATLNQMGQNWIEDPSNENDQFTRIQARKLLSQAPIEGLNSKRLSDTAKRMRRVRLLLDKLTEQLAEKIVKIDDQDRALGICQVDIKELAKADEEIALRLLSKLLTQYGGNIYPPRLLPIERLLSELEREGFSGATLAGCRLVCDPNNENSVYFGREESGVSQELPLNKAPIMWDHRFQISKDDNLPPLLVKKLDLGLWREIEKQKGERVAPTKRAYLGAMPGVYLPQQGGDILVAVPPLQYWQEGMQGVKAIFALKQLETFEMP